MLLQGNAEKGRDIWLASGFQRSGKMVDDSHVCAYLREQVELVESQGECEGGCSETEEIKHYAHGRLVCPHTLRPCPKKA